MAKRGTVLTTKRGDAGDGAGYKAGGGAGDEADAGIEGPVLWVVLLAAVLVTAVTGRRSDGGQAMVVMDCWLATWTACSSW